MTALLIVGLLGVAVGIFIGAILATAGERAS